MNQINHVTILKPRPDCLSLVAYKVEKRPVGETKWQPASKYPVRGTNLTVGDLEPGVEYEFQVSAENEAGVSEPAIIASPVTPVEAKRKNLNDSFISSSKPHRLHP